MTVSNSKRSSEQNSGSSFNFPNRFLYLVIGGGIGAAVALLFAPKSGADLRGDISELTSKKYEEALELAQQLKEQSAEVYQSLREKTDKVYDLASARLSLSKVIDEDPTEKAARMINSESERPQKQSTTTTRRSSSTM